LAGIGNRLNRRLCPPDRSQRPDLSLRLSQTCATAADAFWHRGGYEHPPAPVKGWTENWTYQSHYNTELKRCFVLVEVVTHSPSDSMQNQEVFDAIESGESLASMNVVVSTARTYLLKANTRITATPENLAWFHGLMTK
jgi:hypothetical protein